jgi:hypothetical protein
MKSYQSDSKDKYHTMERKEQVSPFKILKMINGDDVLCKVVKEYDDALVIEMPMSVMKHMVHQGEDHIIEHTGLHRWLNYTNDPSIVVYKDRILSYGSLAPEVVFYYKMFCKKVRRDMEDGDAENTSEEEMMEQIRKNVEKVAQHIERNELEHNKEDMEEDQTIEIVNGPKRILH